MENKVTEGWKKLLAGYPWFNCEGCYPLPAYSEFMPSPLVGRKPMGEIDYRIFSDDDPYGWKISEMEEEYEIRPGTIQIGNQIMSNIVRLGKGLPEHHIHGHGHRNLIGNPYWPDELSSHAGMLHHERYVTFLPAMLSRTQDDKGRVTWTFFGNSIHDPEYAFWRGFYSNPTEEYPSDSVSAFFKNILKGAYGEEFDGKETLYRSGFRILPVNLKSELPKWTDEFKVSDNDSFDSVRYLLTFRPFSGLPDGIRELYLAGKLALLPFPGSLVFWGMNTYNKLRKELPEAAQLPLLHLVTRHRGIAGTRVPQAGWFYEPHPNNPKLDINENLLHDSFHRTHRWQKIHRYQDELNESAEKVRIAKALFSTESSHLGLYDKPLARNCQIIDHDFNLILNGPKADRQKIYQAEKKILGGGLFGYRFFYPPMRTGQYRVYWNRPLVAWMKSGSEDIEIESGFPAGFLTCYHDDDVAMEKPVELWPRIQRREIYLSALLDFTNGHDHYAHQTSKNILSLLESWQMNNGRRLSRPLAEKLLTLPKNKTLDQWLGELPIHTQNAEAAVKMRQYLEQIIEPEAGHTLPQALTFSVTANRDFEEAWWNNIKYLAHGEYIYKDNADVADDEVTKKLSVKKTRDIENLGDYFISRYKKAIAEAGMEGEAIVGELPFKWDTDFEYSIYGGWKGNQDGDNYERNILVVIPGRNRKEAVVFGDHYDTAYMEDVFEKDRGGSGARFAAHGADDNYSASATLLLAAPIFLKMSKEGKLERDIWLIHLTGEEFPADCMGARNFCRRVIEKNIRLKCTDGKITDLSSTIIRGVYVMDMIGHNRDNDQDIFQISPGKSAASLALAREAHISNLIWNSSVHEWNRQHNRLHLERGKRITAEKEIPDPAKYLALSGEVRTQFNPHSSIFNTDGQIFSDVGIPVVLFMENYDINRSGYHDTKDTMENIDLDYGSAFASIAIETVARVATLKEL